MKKLFSVGNEKLKKVINIKVRRYEDDFTIEGVEELTKDEKDELMHECSELINDNRYFFNWEKIRDITGDEFSTIQEWNDFKDYLEKCMYGTEGNAFIEYMLDNYKKLV